MISIIDILIFSLIYILGMALTLGIIEKPKNLDDCIDVVYDFQGLWLLFWPLFWILTILGLVVSFGAIMTSYVIVKIKNLSFKRKGN